MDELNFSPGNNLEQPDVDNGRQELPPVQSQPEFMPEPTSPESAPIGHERKQELSVERPQQDQGIMLPPVQTQQDTTIVPPPPDDSSVSQDDPYGTPLAADDIDVIEKEWVNKAKQIINDTKDDPYAQEEAMEKLQIEYLKKRYGKTINPTR